MNLRERKKLIYSMLILAAIAVSMSITIIALIMPQKNDYELNLTVGQYDNEPKIYEDDDRKVVGIFPEVLEYIAEQESWKIEYKKGDWDKCLERLENGEIDIMVDVAYSETRADKYDFNSVEVLNNWGILYQEEGENIESIDDLEGKDVATLAGSIHTDGDEGIKNMTKKWNVTCNFIELSSYEKVFKYVDEGKAEIGVVNRLFGLFNEDDYKVERTSIMFNPSRLLFAFPKNAKLNKELIPIIDEHLLEMKEDPDSIYYQILEKYIYQEEGEIILPDWVLPVIFVAIAAIVMLSSTSFVLRRMVNNRTTELRHQSDFAQLISDISRKFVGKTQNVDLLIEEALKNIVKLTNTDSGYILQLSEDKINFNMTHLWHTKRIAYQKKRFQNLVVSEMPYWMVQLEKGNIIAVPSVEQLPSEAKNEKIFLSSSGIKSIIDVPITYEGELIGMMGLSAMNENREWNKDEINLLRIICQVMSSAMALHKVLDELEERVDERTKELKEANERLQELDKLKSMFLASMSHELRTPLNSIIGFTGWLLMGMEGDLNEEQHKQLSMVKSSANHLLELINEVLDISKIEAGKVEVNVEEFELSDLFEEILGILMPLATEKNLELSYDIPNKINMKSDKRRIKQVIMNFLSNSIKFTDEGSVRVKVYMLDNDKIEVVVSDTGIGIKDQDLMKLFQPFQQVDMSSTRKHEGTGLGLYLCKRIIEMLCGEISATSEYGKGSKFKFIIPITHERGDMV